MPWCEDCAKFWTPTSMPPDGSCPTCHRVIAEPPDTSVPWHFWVLVACLVLYLGWRLVQLFQWLVGEGHVLIALALGAAVVASSTWGATWWWRGRALAEDDAGGAREDPVA